MLSVLDEGVELLNDYFYAMCVRSGLTCHVVNDPQLECHLIDVLICVMNVNVKTCVSWLVTPQGVGACVFLELLLMMMMILQMMMIVMEVPSEQ